jgi:hypothetical protein
VVRLKIVNLFLLAALLAPCACRAGAIKTGGAYEVLLDSANASGGQSEGGNYTVLSSIGQRTSNGPVTTSTYTLVSGMMGAVDTTPPTVAISSPLPAAVATGTVSAIGTAFDQNDIRWTLYVGGGTNPAAWEQLSDGAGNMASSYTFGDWDSTRYSGDYTFKLVAVDGHGNTAEGKVTFNVHYTFTITGTVPAFKWIFMGVPVGVSSADPVSLFGADEKYKIYKWDPTAEPNQYVSKYRYPSVLRAGDGFWIRAFYDDLNYSYPGSPVETNQNYTIELKEGWNMISSPYNNAFPWDSVQVAHDGNTYDLAAAAGAGLIDSTMYTYDTNNKSWVQNGPGSQMQPQVGCYVNAYDDLELVFEPVRRNFAARVVARRAVDYRINISASAGESTDPYNYFGAASMSDEEFDPFDSKEPPRSLDAIEGKYISLYFPRDGWRKNAGQYTNDMRPLAVAGETESWTFNVDTNEIGGTVELKWDKSALPSDRFGFALVRLDSGDSIDMAALDSYSYKAEGKGNSSASFRIDVVKIGIGATKLAYTLKPGWNLISIPLEFDEPAAESQLGENMNQLDVVQFYNGKYYTAQSGEGIDFQAGIAYWLYTDSEMEIEFHGLTMDETSVVEVPLEEGFNTIGSPFGSGMAFGDNISVIVDGVEETLSEAVNNGTLDGALYRYDTLDKTYIKTELNNYMESWTGYFIETNRNCTLKLKK